MPVATLQAVHFGTHAEIMLFGDVDASTALALREALHRARSYYRYRDVVIRIHSLGGELAALSYIQDTLDVERRQGVKVHTEAEMQAQSAAALLLSFGEIGTRTVAPSAVLLYHHTRLIRTDRTEITGLAAQKVGVAMVKTDMQLIYRLIAHISRGFGGVRELATAGLRRCDSLLASKSTAAPQQPATLHDRRGFIRGARKAFAAMSDRADTIAYARLLSIRFAEDTAMSVKEAWCLMLIDSIRDMPDLQFDTVSPAASEPTQPGWAATHIFPTAA